MKCVLTFPFDDFRLSSSISEINWWTLTSCYFEPFGRTHRTWAIVKLCKLIAIAYSILKNIRNWPKITNLEYLWGSIAAYLELVSGSKQIKVNRYVKKSIYISHYLHNLMKFSLHNLLDFKLNDVISKLGPMDSYDFSWIQCEPSNFQQIFHVRNHAFLVISIQLWAQSACN